MSEAYTHQLIPTSPSYRPTPEAVAQFMQGLIDRGNLPADVEIKFARVENSPGQTRELVNPFTGEPAIMRLPSRRGAGVQSLAGTGEMARLAADADEYNMWVAGSGLPKVPPFSLGTTDGTGWKPWNDAYSLEVVCRVRKVPVNLSFLLPGQDPAGPFDPMGSVPHFDEDAETVPSDGIAVHPDAEPRVVPGAGAGMFWIEFELGKWLYPQMREGKIDIIDESVMKNAREAFGCDFLQSCKWG